MFRHMDSFSLFDDIHPLQTAQPTIWKAHGDVVTPNSKFWNSAVKSSNGRDQFTSPLPGPWEFSSPAPTDVSTERYCSRSVSPSACSSSGSSRRDSSLLQSFDDLFGQATSLRRISSASSSTTNFQCPAATTSTASLPMRMPQPAAAALLAKASSSSTTTPLPFCRSTLSYDFLEPSGTSSEVSPSSSGSNAFVASSSPSASFPDLSAMFTPVPPQGGDRQQLQQPEQVSTSPAVLEALLKMRSLPPTTTTTTASSFVPPTVGNADMLEVLRSMQAPPTLSAAPTPAPLDMDNFLQSLLAFPPPFAVPSQASSAACTASFSGRSAADQSDSAIEAALGFMAEDRGDLLSALAMSQCTHLDLLAAFVHNSRVAAEDAAAEAAQRSFPGRHCGTSPAAAVVDAPYAQGRSAFAATVSFAACPTVDTVGLQSLINQLLAHGGMPSGLLGATTSQAPVSLPLPRHLPRQQQSVARGGVPLPLRRTAAAAPLPSRGGRGRPLQQRGGADELQQALLAKQAAALAALQRQQQEAVAVVLQRMHAPHLGDTRVAVLAGATMPGSAVPPPHMPFGQMLQKMSASRRSA